MRAEPYARAGAQTGTSDERPIMSCDSTPLPPLPTALPVSSPAAQGAAQLSCLGNLVHSPLLLALGYCLDRVLDPGQRQVGGRGRRDAQAASRKAKKFAISVWAAVIGLIVDVVHGVTRVLLASKK